MSLSTVHRARRKACYDDDGTVEQCPIWMTKAVLRRWPAQQQAKAHSGNPAYADSIRDRSAAIAKRAKAAGMSV